MSVELPYDSVRELLDEARRRLSERSLSAKVRHFVWTADPVDPCPYCVEWRRADDGCGWEPVNPDGAVPIAVYNRPHDRCLEALAGSKQEGSDDG